LALQAEALAKAWGMSTCSQRIWLTAQRVEIIDSSDIKKKTASPVWINMSRYKNTNYFYSFNGRMITSFYLWGPVG
jgi:hypothetical protein